MKPIQLTSFEADVLQVTLEYLIEDSRKDHNHIMADPAHDPQFKDDYAYRERQLNAILEKLMAARKPAQEPG